jgi:hypothetical protein
VLNDSRTPSEGENPKCGAGLGLLLGPLFWECLSHRFYFMLTSQHHINDWINILLTLNFEHIVKMLWNHRYMKGASLWWKVPFKISRVLKKDQNSRFLLTTTTRQQ